MEAVYSSETSGCLRTARPCNPEDRTLQKYMLFAILLENYSHLSFLRCILAPVMCCKWLRFIRLEFFPPDVIDDNSRYSNFQVHTSHFLWLPRTLAMTVSHAHPDVLVRRERHLAHSSRQFLWTSTTVFQPLGVIEFFQGDCGRVQLLRVCASGLHTHTWQ
jgi:hypothetical protein